MSKQAIFKEGTLVRIKPKCEHLYKNLIGSVGVVEQYVKIQQEKYVRYFVVVRFFGIDHDYHMSVGVLEVIKHPDQLSSKNHAQPIARKAIEDSKNLYPDATPVSDQLLRNVDRALDAAAARIKARAELRAKAEQERQKNSVTIHVPYTRVFRVAENADAVRAKLRTVYNLLISGQSVSPAQIKAIADNFDECQKMIYEIASYAVQNAQRVNK